MLNKFSLSSGLDEFPKAVVLHRSEATSGLSARRVKASFANVPPVGFTR